MRMHNARHRRSPAVKTHPGPLLLMRHGTRLFSLQQTSDVHVYESSEKA